MRLKDLSSTVSRDDLLRVGQRVLEKFTWDRPADQILLKVTCGSELHNPSAWGATSDSPRQPRDQPSATVRVPAIEPCCAPSSLALKIDYYGVTHPWNRQLF